MLTRQRSHDRRSCAGCAAACQRSDDGDPGRDCQFRGTHEEGRV